MNKKSPEEVIRIANCSGFYGDKLSAAREMLEGGPIDVLTGDYLAELTMAILHRKREQNKSTGYVATFLKQVRDIIAPCLKDGVKIISNAGGLNPRGMAEAVEAIIEELGLTARVAYITGDDLIPRLDELLNCGETLSHMETGESLAGSGSRVLTANIYLGAWGIKHALDQGADIVICPRVTDAALVIGPAAWKFQWQRDDYNALAGALLAGHLIECGPSVTGGNYAFFEEVANYRNIGYPIAAIEASGNFTITKHPGTGGLVSIGTVTAQLLYEINSPAYLNPDVIAHFDTAKLEQVAADRVYVSGCLGSCPPPSHKVCLNMDGGIRACLEMVVTGLDIEAKVKIFTDVLFESLGGRDQYKEVIEELIRTDKKKPVTNDEASAILRLGVLDQEEGPAVREFNRKAVELALANYPGFCARPPAIPSGPLIKHWPALIKSHHVVEQVHINGEETDVLPTSQLCDFVDTDYQVKPAAILFLPEGPMVQIPFGRLFGARSGDKGGCANLGVWAKTDKAYQYLRYFLTTDQLMEMLPDIASFPIDRYELPNVRALNFYIHGILGDGVAASKRTDGQAKSLGEYLRVKLIDAPGIIIQKNK